MILVVTLAALAAYVKIYVGAVTAAGCAPVPRDAAAGVGVQVWLAGLNKFYGFQTVALLKLT